MRLLKWLAIGLALLALWMSAPAWADRGFRPHHGPSHGSSFGKQHFRGHPHFRPHRPHFRDHRHARLGIFFTIPLVTAIAPPVIAAPYSPPVYIEQADGPMASGYWYYCDNPQGYYPYVRTCPGGWQKVVPQPPPY